MEVYYKPDRQNLLVSAGTGGGIVLGAAAGQGSAVLIDVLSHVGEPIIIIFHNVVHFIVGNAYLGLYIIHTLLYTFMHFNKMFIEFSNFSHFHHNWNKKVYTQVQNIIVDIFTHLFTHFHIIKMQF